MTVDVEAIRARMMEEVAPMVEELKGDGNILALVVVGSAAWGAVTEKSDVDLLAITRESIGHGFGVTYRYFLPRFSGVPRRTEVGYFPKAFIDQKIEDRFGDVISQRLVEQLKNARILWERDSAATEVVQRCKAVTPSPGKLGEDLYDIKKTLAVSGIAAQRGAAGAAAHMARYAARSALVSLAMQKHSRAFAKYKHEIKGFRKLEPGRVPAYEDAWGVRGISGEASGDIVAGSGELVGSIFEKLGIERGFALEWEAVAGHG